MLNVKIASLDEKIFDGKLDKITIKTIDGVITLLENHIPIISIIENGYVIYNENNEEKKFNIASGNILLDNKNNVSIMINKKGTN